MTQTEFKMTELFENIYRNVYHVRVSKKTQRVVLKLAEKAIAELALSRVTQNIEPEFV